MNQHRFTTVTHSLSNSFATVRLAATSCTASLPPWRARPYRAARLSGPTEAARVRRDASKRPRRRIGARRRSRPACRSATPDHSTSSHTPTERHRILAVLTRATLPPQEGRRLRDVVRHHRPDACAGLEHLLRSRSMTVAGIQALLRPSRGPMWSQESGKLTTIPPRSVAAAIPAPVRQPGRGPAQPTPDD